jgi:hypothetical protein
MPTTRMTIACSLTCSVLFSGGCSTPSPTTVLKIGFKVVGKAVDYVEVVEFENKLICRPVEAATAEFGPPNDVFRDVRGGRRWLGFPVKLDVPDKYRYVVEVDGNRIVAVSKVEKGGANELDIPAITSQTSFRLSVSQGPVKRTVAAQLKQKVAESQTRGCATS